MMIFCVGPATGASSGQRPGPTPTDLPARLRRRLFWYFAAALLALAMGVGAATIVPLLGRLTRSEEAGLSHVAETRALAVGEWFRRAGGLARQITSRTQIRDLMEGVAQGRVTREHFAAFAGERLMDAMRLSPDMAGITRLGPNGEPLAACGVAIPREVWAIPPQGSDELALSAPVLLSGRLCVVIGAPIPGSRGGRAGTDLVAVDTVALGEKIMSPLAGDGSSRLLLGRADGDGVQAFLARPGEGPGGAIKLSPLERRALALGVSQRSGILSTPEEAAAYTPVADAGWGLILTADARRLYAPVHAELVTMLASAAGIYALCLAGFGILLRPLAGRILLHAGELASLVEEKTRQLQVELAARTAAERALKEAQSGLERRVEERTSKLAEANAELLALHGRLEAEVEERKALSRELLNLLEGMRLDLSRDLHDHTGQQLTTLRLQLNAALSSLPEGENACRPQLESAAQKVDQVQREIKGIARGLRPDTLDFFGLTTSLEALLDEQRASSGLNFHFFHNDAPRDFDRDKALALYRIAQEALSNVARHARAQNVHVYEGRTGR